jgi:hypothetical protein
MERLLGIWFVIFGLLLPMVASADHLPDELHSTGKAETSLAGISISRTSPVSEAIKRYGPPTERKLAANNTAWVGYRWVLKSAILEVGASNDIITDIYVELTGAGTRVGTGSGLNLGDDLARLKAIYGNKYQDWKYPDLSIGGGPRARSERIPYSGVWERQRVVIQWASPEYTLSAGLDDQGKIVSLCLLRPECFPGECK